MSILTHERTLKRVKIVILNYHKINIKKLLFQKVKKYCFNEHVKCEEIKFVEKN